MFENLASLQLKMHLTRKSNIINGAIELTRSKSESNRALMIQTLCEETFDIEHLATADDTQLLASALGDYKFQDEINVGHAGTSYRFLTAFLATRTSGKWLLTGSQRMKERPIGILVDALRQVGANIEYEDIEGFPPLRIWGSSTLNNKIIIEGGVSSQYISALLLVSPSLADGLEIELVGNITSRPYLEMTLSMMNYFGVVATWKEQTIVVKPQKYRAKNITIEGDWSAASYWYGFIALSNIGSKLQLSGLNKNSLQGDAILKDIYENFGVKSTFVNGGWLLEKHSAELTASFSLDLNKTPDIAQTILCTCAGLGVSVSIKGLHTLKIKETDRVVAMKMELAKFGIVLNVISDDEVSLAGNQQLNTPNEIIATYQDHRMAMSFATLAMRTDLKIENPEVVSKSYPSFWNDVESVLG